MRKGFVYILLHLSFVLAGQSADWQPFTREVVISSEDSVIRANILIMPVELKLEDELFYYWYNKGQINRNMGGYSGDLLSGDYLVFDNNKNMITRGAFYYGLKDGTWKYWYHDGNIKRIENWEMGRLDGEIKIYNKSRGILKTVYYKDGLKIDPKIQKQEILKIKLSKEKSDTTVTKIDTTEED